MLNIWISENRAPTRAEWNVWTEITERAANERRRSGWAGTDAIYDDGYAAGYAAAMADMEAEDTYNPAGPYPYA